MTKINLHLGDCMEGMRYKRKNHWDLGIVDPPYGLGDTWSKSRKDRFYHKGKLHKYQNDKIPDELYFEKLQKVTSNQIIFGGNYYTDFLPPVNGWIIWDKCHSEKSFMSHIEMAWTSFKKAAVLLKHPWDGARKGIETGIKKIHPHQKPIGLYMEALIKRAKPLDKILDTHGGSMSSAIACGELGFDLDLWEKDEDYFNAGVARVKRHFTETSILYDIPEINVIK